MGEARLASVAFHRRVSPTAQGRGMQPRTRFERQHHEIVSLLLSDDCARGQALAREHLAEFPNDLVVTRLLAESIDDPGDDPTT
jgi:DNA-binding GntR family transcriptional regulator